MVAGRFWHGYQAEPVEFSHWHQLITGMERFFDDIQFPFPTTNFRSFGDTQRRMNHRQETGRTMADEELLKKRGDLGSFIVRVQHRQNSSWQGRITWIEEDKTVYFRSIWEMIKLVESALDTVDIEKEGMEISWSEEPEA